jgi:hypothetical protein
VSVTFIIVALGVGMDFMRMALRQAFLWLPEWALRPIGGAA